MDTPASKSRGGRPSKGPRHATKVRIPIAHYERYLAEAERQGFDSLSDYLVTACARAHGLEVPDLRKRTQQQSTLPISA